MFCLKKFIFKSLILVSLTVIFPDVTLYSLGIKLTSVDFPQPDMPTKATNFPDSITRLILFKIISSLNVAHEQVIFVTENGFGNKISIDSYNEQNRGGQGVISIKTSERNGQVVGAVNLENTDFIILITNKGKTIKISASDMKTINRNTQGVRLQDMSDSEKISAVSSERTNE